MNLNLRSKLGILLFGILTLVVLRGASAQAPGFDKQFESYTRLSGPGFAAMVIKNGQVVYQKGFGFASLKKKSKQNRIDSATLFNLASNSKQFTAMGILLLEQAKKLSLEDPISKFIPESPNYMKPIKIGHLVYHTSGLPDYMEVCAQKPKVFNADILATLFKKQNLLFPAGSRYEYSNSGYVVLSEVIQRISGKSFPDFIREEIFRKIGMTNSVVFSEESESKITRRATGYNEWPYLTENDFSPCNYNFGDGGVYTSLDDYRKWASFLENPSLLLAPEFQGKFFESGKTDAGASTGYAYGWQIDEFDGKKMIVHTGAWVGFRSFATFIPDQHLWIVLMSNYRGISINSIAMTFLKEFAQ